MADQHGTSHEATLVKTASELDLPLNVPEVNDFPGLIRYTYYEFCLAMDYINNGVYVSRAKMETTYAKLLTKVYRDREGDQYHEGAFALNRAIYGMAGGKESDLENYWVRKAYECSKPREEASQSMLKELATSLLGNPADLDLALSDMGRLSLPQTIPDEEISGIPKAAKKLLLATLAIRPRVSEADQVAEFMALRNISMANVNKTSIESGGPTIYGDFGDKKENSGGIAIGN